MRYLSYSLLCNLGFCPEPVLANSPVYDKSKYSLFCPVPDKMLKEMATDRPDKTESPFTIDAGHYQLEFDMATYTYDTNKHNNTRTHSYTIFAPNLRVGLTSNLEVDLIATAFNSIKTKDTFTAETTRNQGIDDTLIRFSYNFWGNEGESTTAFGIIPYVKIPTNQDHLGNKSYDGGILLPFNIKFTETLGLGLMTEVDYMRGNNVHKHVFKFANMGSLSWDFSETFGTFFEIYTERSTEQDSRWIATFDTGLIITFTENWQMDMGVYFGLTPEADDVTPFIGMSIRF
ncbi:transporter [Candidatus Paracaedibacter symbiosus]|uniref:transporter n=1 Tax=Candidatus Paracaedibacter symbiosus TaxID=244582 RepID=UPI00068CF10E|nr:transporter [Candidatus Paracaedibacter symbiosus]